MLKKLKFTALPLTLLMILGACSDDEAAETEKESAPAETETAEQQPAESELELPAEEDIAVVVNGEEIPGSIYNSVARQLEGSLASQGQQASDPEVAEQVKSQAISVIVGNKLIIQDAKEKGHSADDAEVEKRLEEFTSQFESEETLNASLEQSGYTMDDFEEQMREQLIYESYLAEEIEAEDVTKEEVQEAYDGYAETTEEEAPAFEEMEPMIRQSLEEQKTQQAVLERIEDLKEDAEVEVKI